MRVCACERLSKYVCAWRRVSVRERGGGRERESLKRAFRSQIKTDDGHSLFHWMHHWMHIWHFTENISFSNLLIIILKIEKWNRRKFISNANLIMEVYYDLFCWSVTACHGHFCLIYHLFGWNDFNFRYILANRISKKWSQGRKRRQIAV